MRVYGSEDGDGRMATPTKTKRRLWWWSHRQGRSEREKKSCAISAAKHFSVFVFSPQHNRYFRPTIHRTQPCIRIHTSMDPYMPRLEHGCRSRPVATASAYLATLCIPQ